MSAKRRRQGYCGSKAFEQNAVWIRGPSEATPRTGWREVRPGPAMRFLACNLWGLPLPHNGADPLAFGHAQRDISIEATTRVIAWPID